MAKMTNARAENERPPCQSRNRFKRWPHLEPRVTNNTAETADITTLTAPKVNAMAAETLPKPECGRRSGCGELFGESVLMRPQPDAGEEEEAGGKENIGQPIEAAMLAIQLLRADSPNPARFVKRQSGGEKRKAPTTPAPTPKP